MGIYPYPISIFPKHQETGVPCPLRVPLFPGFSSNGFRGSVDETTLLRFVPVRVFLVAVVDHVAKPTGLLDFYGLQRLHELGISEGFSHRSPVVERLHAYLYLGKKWIFSGSSKR